MDETEKSDLESSLHKFWDLETLGIREDEKTVTEDFYDSIYINEEGRYEAKLPFKETHPILHDHYKLCEIRLEKLVLRLKKEPELLKKYNDIFIEQKELGIIEECEDLGSPGNCHYIPHHPVIRERTKTQVKLGLCLMRP